MPYLTEINKNKMLDHMYPETAGELNYLITIMCKRYWNKSRRNYDAHNSIIGALECAKQEWYRRATSVYEDEKIKTNGDVY